MINIQEYNINPITHNVLRESFGEYNSPKDKISRLQKSGSLIRLRKGIYVVAPEQTGALLSMELIANHILGPSYISYESALSYYGFIPERVFQVRSATLKRSKNFRNELGEFEYTTVPVEYYPVGIRIETIDNKYAFIIATPEKAICDLIIATSGLRLQSVKSVREYLTESLRIDEDTILTLNTSIIEECINTGYKKNDLFYLKKYIEHEQHI
ncbi:MAG: hypothetical protein IPO21_00270 [Bacteroidales bacterium]|nr:hypothetical protein [Bacteroidales bacterium]